MIEIAIWCTGLAIGNTGQARLWAVQYAGFWPGLLGDWQSNFHLQPATMFASYSFVHAGPIHLLGNLVLMIWLARWIGSDLSPAATLEVWVGSVLGGAAAFGLLSQSSAPMVGASGGVFGLIGAFVVLDHQRMRRRRGAARAILQTLATCALILALSLVDVALRNAVLAWQAHLGGFLIGAALTAALDSGDGTRSRSSTP